MKKRDKLDKREKRKKQLYLIGLNNWLSGKKNLDEFVFLSGGFAYVVGGFRIELIVLGLGFIVMLKDK
jgi:hypothetical protein